MKGKQILIVLSLLLVIGILIWQGLVFAGNPDPITDNLSITSAILSSGVLVFREGLEAILVLSAITATLSNKKQKNYGKGITLGSGLGILATVITWIIVVSIISSIHASEYDIQAATGLLAIIVLLVVMNWFFHKIYWTGWISHHTKRGRRLVESTEKSSYSMLRGFVLLGFTAIYREGFEIVLFLQQMRLKEGSAVVFAGAAIGILLTGMVAVITFIAHKKLPYKKMLILTGFLLGIVLLVMVGESIQEMQQANWLPTTSIDISIPSWMGMWFAVFPNVQGLLAQAGAALIVLGSYVLVRYRMMLRPSN